MKGFLAIGTSRWKQEKGKDDSSNSMFVSSRNGSHPLAASSSLQNANYERKAFSLVRDSPREYSHLVCRDCYAPPGALGIILHTTNQGPIVHSIRDGSRLATHISPGDLIIAMNDIDTRFSKAEDVMQMLMDRRSQQRKLTVVSPRVENALPATI